MRRMTRAVVARLSGCLAPAKFDPTKRRRPCSCKLENNAAASRVPVTANGPAKTMTAEPRLCMAAAAIARHAQRKHVSARHGGGFLTAAAAGPELHPATSAQAGPVSAMQRASASTSAAAVRGSAAGLWPNAQCAGAAVRSCCCATSADVTSCATASVEKGRAVAPPLPFWSGKWQRRSKAAAQPRRLDPPGRHARARRSSGRPVVGKLARCVHILQRSVRRERSQHCAHIIIAEPVRQRPHKPALEQQS